MSVRSDCLSFRGGIGTTENGQTPCAEGYGANLCDECVKGKDGTQYERITVHSCSKCPNKTTNALRIVGTGLTVLVFITISIA